MFCCLFVFSQFTGREMSGESLGAKLASVFDLVRPSHNSEVKMDCFISLAVAADKTAAALKRTELKPNGGRQQPDWL